MIGYSGAAEELRSMASLPGPPKDWRGALRRAADAVEDEGRRRAGSWTGLPGGMEWPSEDGAPVVPGSVATFGPGFTGVVREVAFTSEGWSVRGMPQQAAGRPGRFWTPSVEQGDAR